MRKFIPFYISLYLTLGILLSGCQWIATHPDQVKEAEQVVEVVAEEVVKDLAK